MMSPTYLRSLFHTAKWAGDAPRDSLSYVQAMFKLCSSYVHTRPKFSKTGPSQNNAGVINKDDGRTGPPNAGWQTRYNPPSIREGILRKIP